MYKNKFPFIYFTCVLCFTQVTGKTPLLGHLLLDVGALIQHFEGELLS